MERFTNTDIKSALSELRADIRVGDTQVLYSQGGTSALRKAVAVYLNLRDEDSFTREFFANAAILRFSHLFDVPTFARKGHTYYPTQDQTAWAIQNFINRRKNVWSHVTFENVKDVEPTMDAAEIYNETTSDA